MGRLHASSDISETHHPSSALQSRYMYAAQCSQTGITWQLPRTDEVKSIAKGLMQQLAEISDHPKEGNLYGVLLVQKASGERTVLKGFSGIRNPGHLQDGRFSGGDSYRVQLGRDLDGKNQIPGWVPPLTTDARMVLIETQVLARLAHLKKELIALKDLPVRTDYKQVSQRYANRLKQLAQKHRLRKQRRDRKRTHYQNTLQGDALKEALDNLTRESQQDSIEFRHLKQKRKQTLSPLTATITQAEQQIQHLKHQYTTLSQQWQAQMQIAYCGGSAGQMPAFEGLSFEICERAAAKLLYYAATHRLQPLAMAEFWWGQPQGEYYPEQFYDASPEDCQMLMTLSQMPTSSSCVPDIKPLSILYQDETLIVVDKPAGLLSVPGRRYHHQDSVLSRLRRQLPDYDFLQVAHRLDQATSGILVLTTSQSAHAALGQQFSQRRVHKTYEAILSRPVAKDSGTIKLPLWGNPKQRPLQSVNIENGKPSITYFQILQTGQRPRVNFTPHTGRTHQLRVHAAHPQGLNSPILGDTLYGQTDQIQRLCLHATSIRFVHPVNQTSLHLTSDAPF